MIIKILDDEFPKETHAFPTDDLNHIAASYGNLGEAFFVALANGKVVGTVGIKQEDKRTALLRRFFVEAPHRRQKIGSRLLERAIAFCREVGYDELIFKTTSTMERAIRLCEKKGFIPRAKLDLGLVQLLKYALFLKPETAVPQARAQAESL